MPMIPERKALWLAALRSGEFPQGRSMLRTAQGEYCCLGVACEMYRRETGDGEWVRREGTGRSTYSYFVTDTGKHDLSMPRKVADWYGLETLTPDSTIADPIIETPEGHKTTLANLNDDPDGWDFKAIADIIEQQL